MKIGYFVKINMFVSMNSSFRATYISYMYPMIRKNSTEQHKTGIQTRVFFLTQNLLEQFEDANTNGTSTKDRQFNGQNRSRRKIKNKYNKY